MMSIIENHILSIVNNNNGIIDFGESYLWHDEDFNEYLEEIDFDCDFDFSSYHYDYNLYKWEIMNILHSDHIRERFYNDTIVELAENVTDADKHIMLKFLFIECAKPYCEIAINHVTHDYVEDNWRGIICSYVFLKVHNMIYDPEQWLQDSIVSRIEDWLRNKLREKRDKLREKVITNIALSKIKRNKIFNLGLGLKLSIINCGIMVGE